MKITVEIDEAMGEKIDLEARKDGHSNRNAVIRKALNLFFDNEVNYGQSVNKETCGQKENTEEKNDSVE